MYHRDIHIDKWLTPISCLYGAAVSFRNFLFDKQLLLHTRHFDIPVICVGNLTVGGTGKTPHTEYLIRLLQKDYNVAVLSRGYKRHTKGYILANAQSTAEEIGDEPFQMLKKFPQIRVAVDSDRCRGISNLMTLRKPAVDVILLDDAFQHRYVAAGINILLTSCERPFYNDKLLPAGRLRESIIGKERAQIIVVTKCPEDIKPIDFNVISKGVNPQPCQELFFSQFCYGSLYAMFKSNKVKTLTLDDLKEDTSVLLITGIANPTSLIDKLHDHVVDIKTLNFADHHDFGPEDIKRINTQYGKLPKGNRLIITTEKDASRLRSQRGMSDAVKRGLFILPIKVDILQDKQELFNQLILDYVRENQRNSSLSAQ
jgi:tetraacyldisaccharide 4'-kinase